MVEVFYSASTREMLSFGSHCHLYNIYTLNRTSQQTHASAVQRFILLVLLKETVTKNSENDKEHISRDLLLV
jgi:hypothetical protein